VYDDSTGAPVIRDVTITKFRRLLPAGPVAIGEPNSPDGLRAQHLIQIYTDRGLRTVTVATIRLKKPRVKAADE